MVFFIDIKLRNLIMEKYSKFIGSSEYLFKRKSEKMPEKTILENGIVVTMDRAGKIIENGTVVIEGNKIIDVGRTGVIKKKYKGDVVIDAKDKVILPGLVDLHIHTCLLRGVCDDIPLVPYVEKFWAPYTSAMKPSDTYAAALLTYCEAIKSGTTCVNDIYNHMIKCAEAAEKIGIRAVLSSEATDEFPGMETLRDNERLIIEKNGAANGRIRTGVGIDWFPTSSIEFLEKAKAIAEKHKVGIHAHANESINEVELCKKRHVKAPIELSHDLGLLGPKFVGAHCVWLSNKEIKMMKETGANVAHNPTSNAKLGSGIAMVPELIKAGVNVGIGHDDTTCNNNADMFEAMKWTSLVQRASRLDAGIMTAKQVLGMATMNGARGLGMENEIGSVEAGKKADLIMVNLRSLHFAPLILQKYFNLFSHLVYSAHGEDVDTVIVDGKMVMKNKVLLNVDEAEVIEKAQQACEDLLGRIDLVF